MWIRAPLVTVLLSLALAAQSTLIVDASGNGNFLDLPPAVAAARPGDLVLVRPGYYSPATISTGIRIVGLPGATIGGLNLVGLVFDSVPAGHSCVVRGLTFYPIISTAVRVLDCQGQVHLEDMTLQSVIDVQRSSAVSLLRVDVQRAGVPLHAIDSTVSLVLCDLRAGWSSSSLRPAVFIERSTVSLSQTTLVGGPNFTGIGNGSGVELVSGRLIVAGDANASISAGAGVGQLPAPAILSTSGTILVDPQVQLVPQFGAVAIAGAATVTAAQVPAVVADVAAQTLSVDTRGAPGDFALSLVGLAPQPLSSTPFGDLWLGAGSVLFQSGQIPATGALAASLPLPTLPQGLLVTFQAVILRGNQVLLSTPVSTTLD